MKPQNLEERLVWYTIIYTYGFSFLGIQYAWVPGIAYFLTFCLCKKLWKQTENTPPEEKIIIPASVWVWIGAMLIMEFSLIMAHIDFDLGMGKIINTTVNTWAREWALMALFPLIGCLNIRPQLLYRAACILCLQSLVLAIICYLCFLFHIPSISYVSPLGALFRGNSNRYTMTLFEVGETDQFRLQLFTNFPPNLGLVGNIYFFVALLEHNKKWRWIGIIGAAAMVIFSGSRMPIVCLFIVPIVTWALTNFTWPVQIATGLVSFLAGIYASVLIEFIDTAWDVGIKGYRSGSERVRSQLKKIALERWTEAPLWGHGVVAERGPKTTEGMPIGSHEQWSDLLYIRGMVGFIAFLFVMLWSILDLVIKSQKSKLAKAALGIYLVLWVSTFGADIEGAAYLDWPGLILTGMAFKEKAPTFIATHKNQALS